MLAATSAKPPTTEEIKKLTVTDIAIMSGLADSLRDTLKKYIAIDPYTTSDPFDETGDYEYFVVLDNEDPKRLVSMIVTKKDPLDQLPWNDILLNERLIKLSISKEDAAALKYELMPKDTNNFYPYRNSGKVTGYIMFAFQVCGKHQ
jgi:tartrate dehydratase beta subunit/fumarate hydratase class I family protein